MSHLFFITIPSLVFFFKCCKPKQFCINFAKKEPTMQVPTMAEMMTNGETPEILFWVGCAGSFDQRAQKITKAFATILNHVGMKYAILGKEEACTGDPARRSGNEFLFQMMAYNNIQVLNGYGVKKIVTACPHCFNTR